MCFFLTMPISPSFIPEGKTREGKPREGKGPEEEAGRKGSKEKGREATEKNGGK